jgi:hypothetical protein
MDDYVRMQTFAYVHALHRDVKMMSAASQVGEKTVGDHAVSVRQIIGQEVGAMRNKNIQGIAHLVGTF